MTRAAAFLDEGQATWPMPNRDRGFYAAFRAVARYDRSLPDEDALTALPDDPTEAIEGAREAKIQYFDDIM